FRLRGPQSLQLRLARGDGRAVRAEQRLDLRGRQQRDEALLPLAHLGTGEGVAGAGEDAVEGVVVARGERVELVVVAPRAGDGAAQHGTAQVVDRVLERQVVFARAIAAEAPRDGQVTRGD